MTGREPDQFVRFEPVRSADPPKSSGSAGASPSSAFCEPLRVATVSAFALVFSTSARTCSGHPAGSSPAMRRRNCSARSGAAARYCAKLVVPRRLERRALYARVPGLVHPPAASRTADAASRSPRASPRPPSRRARRRALRGCSPLSERPCAITVLQQMRLGRPPLQLRRLDARRRPPRRRGRRRPARRASRRPRSASACRR